jgi:filamentous hemagglutinin family protein
MKANKSMNIKAGRSSSKLNLQPKKIMVLLAAVLAVNAAYANPQGGTVTSGSATITNGSNSTVINQSSQQAIINWNSFNINNGQTTQFIQPNASAIALNRINPTQGASQILGSLTSNGQIILVNAAGIHFGSGAMVSVGGLIASTSDISDANFLAGNYVFDQASSYKNATILNQGKIIAANYGLVALIGSNVTNNGLIQAELGSIVLGSGNTFTLDFNGDQLVNFTVGTPSSSANVTNTGSLIADGGKILVTAQAASNVLDNVIDMGGVAQANSVSQQNGEIVLSSNAGVSVSGQVVAKGLTSDASGGSIQISANQITTSNALIDASGSLGGGSINFTANNAINLNYGSVVQANALASGSGGNIVFNAASTNLTDSLVSAAGLGTGTFGGTIQFASNAINIQLGSLVTASGDFLGGNVTMSGVPVAGSQANASYINLDSWSEISADGTGSDSVVGGNINLYANTEWLAGTISAHDNNTFAVGGNIGIFGQNVYLLPGAFVDASAQFVGGVVTLGGNPLSTSGSTASSLLSTSFFSDVSAAATGTDGFGGVILASADTVSLGGELDVSGNPYPYITYSSSSSTGGNSYGYGGMCGGGGFGGHLTPTINNSGSSGGEILVTGNNITVQSTGYLNAAGNALGGEIELGYDPTASQVSASVNVNAGSVLDAGSYGTTGAPIGGLIKMFATNTNVDGTLNVSGAANSGSLAGEVEIFAQDTVNIGSFANILANGDSDGGEVLIGGDLHGEGFDPSAQFTNVAAGSYISASALTNGIGGEVVVWSTNTTNFGGTIIARGGQVSGNGGEVDIGSNQTLYYDKTAYVNVSAPNGSAGTVTLEPTPTPAPATTTPVFPPFIYKLFF